MDNLPWEPKSEEKHILSICYALVSCDSLAICVQQTLSINVYHLLNLTNS